jgi:hypothetical protein
MLMVDVCPGGTLSLATDRSHTNGWLINWVFFSETNAGVVNKSR